MRGLTNEDLNKWSDEMKDLPDQPLDLYTLKKVREGFLMFSDMSSRTLGFGWINDLIKKLEK